MTGKELLTYAAEFTRRYREAANIYAREAECLRLQFTYALQPMQAGDRVAGRQMRLPLGVRPQSHGGVGYYLHELSWRAAVNDGTLTEAERAEADALLRFWQTENTAAKIAAAYPEDWLDIFVHNAPYNTPAAAHALYRISGIQMDPTRLLTLGVDGLSALCREKLTDHPAFYHGLIQALDILSEVCLRYAAEAKALGKAALAADYSHIAHHPAATFPQAVQLSYLFFVLSGTWNFGRMDQYLGPYLAADLTAGRLTEEEALRWIEDLWCRMEEWNEYFDSRVILGGADRPDGADTFALLAMEATRRRRGVVPQLTLRLYEGMNPLLYERALDTIGEGTTFPMLYNDAVNIPAVMDAFGVDAATAQRYVPYGCGEHVLYNQSIGTPSGTLNTLFVLNEAMYGKNKHLFLDAPDFETFYTAYLGEVEKIVTCLAAQEKLEYDVVGQECPFLYYSLLFDDCIERGKAVLEGGLRHLGGTVENYGNVNTADSLTAVKTVVYEQKLVTAQDLSAALAADFEGQERLRQLLLAQPKYGNDHPDADGMMCRLHRDVCTRIRDCAPAAGLDSYLAVLINNELNAVFGQGTGASADGRRAGEYMANGNNPMSGRDAGGITAMLSSLAKPDTHIHAGAVQNMRFSREMFTTLHPQLKTLLYTYFSQGGAQSMITVLSRGDLEAALREPEKYRHLIVRVGGFSARFVDLSPVVQRELLARTLY
ncbi:MAG: pyruvate formate-lyase [Clostridia bacterium]|nr:pyruvate formate-lyase [Clostridia bacterium]